MSPWAPGRSGSPGSSSSGQRGTIRGMGPLRIGGQHRLAGLPGMGPMPVRHHDSSRRGARHCRANPPPHHLARRSPSGERPLPRRPGVRGPPVRTRSTRSLHAHDRAGQPIRRRCPARAHADRMRPHPRHHLEDLLIGVSEAVSNAKRHGRPPATVRIWATPGRIVVSRSRPRPRSSRSPGGPGPRSSNTADRRLGLGLWVIHQLDIDVALRHADDGFTVRLRGGTITG